MQTHLNQFLSPAILSSQNKWFWPSFKTLSESTRKTCVTSFYLQLIDVYLNTFKFCNFFYWKIASWKPIKISLNFFKKICQFFLLCSLKVLMLFKHEIFLFYKYDNLIKISAVMMIMNASLYVWNFVVFQYFLVFIINTFSIFQMFHLISLPSTRVV